MQLIFWKKIESCPLYHVSHTGIVKNIITQRLCKTFISRGRYAVNLCTKDKYKTFYVDDLVVRAFLNYKINDIVYHRDGDAKNNHENNLVCMSITKYLTTVFGSKWRKIIDNKIGGLYYISSDGKVWSYATRQIIESHVKVGYLSVCIGYPKRIFCHIHRLVAKAFLANPNNHNIVNHKDQDKMNNDVTNLEWCTQQHNVNESVRLTTRKFRSKAVKTQCDNGGIPLWFDKDYIIFPDGRVYSNVTQRYLHHHLNNNGYYRVDIRNKKYYIHILVATTFVNTKPDPKSQVNHKDGDKSNNTVDNLEWCTAHENMKHRCELYKHKRVCKPVEQLDLNTGKVIREFSGVKEAARKTKINSGSIVKACKDQRPSAGGFGWRYRMEKSRSGG